MTAVALPVPPASDARPVIDRLYFALNLIRGKHDMGILTLPPADVERADAVLAAFRAAPLTPDEAAYPRDVFQALIDSNSPYAFYLFQWVPYQTDALRWRLKMLHDVRTFDGREALGIWPNGSSCGPFKDHEVEFIRISRQQWGGEWIDPRPSLASATQKDQSTSNATGSPA